MDRQGQINEDTDSQPQYEPPEQPWPWIVLLIAILALTLVSAYIFRDAISDLTQAHSSRAREREIKAKQESDQRTTEKDVTRQLTLLGKQLKDLRKAAQDTSSEIEAIVGVPLEAAQDHSTQRIDQAILRSPSFAQVWSHILNSRIDPAALQEKQQALDQVRTRLQNGQVSELDRSMLLEMAEWIQVQQERLDQQRQGIAPLKKELGDGLPKTE